MDYYPSSLIHFEAMLDCIARGVERFNFYGISGIFNANDPSYGVWQFKTGGRTALRCIRSRTQAAASLTNSGEHGHRNKAQVTTR